MAEEIGAKEAEEQCEYCGKKTNDYVYVADDCPICKDCDEYLSNLPLEVGVF